MFGVGSEESGTEEHEGISGEAMDSSGTGVIDVVRAEDVLVEAEAIDVGTIVVSAEIGI